MRHRNPGPKLNRSPSHRTAMAANLATALLTHGRIQTTEAKARLARGVAEKAITLAKENTLHSRRQAIALLRNKDDHVPPVRRDRPGLQRRPGRLHPRPEARPAPG